MDRLQSMRVFERVVSEGGFAAAARALDLSAPVVTRLVADLESHLGTRLLQRSTRSVSLTEAGKNYLSRVRSILQDIDEADELVRSENEELAGRLRVHVSILLVYHLLGPELAEFRQRYPRIRLDMEISANQNPAVEEFDATLLVVDQSFNAAVVARKLAAGDIVLVASPAYLERRGRLYQPEDLSSHDFLRLKDPMGSSRMCRMWERGEHGRVLDVPISPTVEANQSDLLLTTALGGGGITTCSLVMAASHLASGALVHVLPNWTVGHFTVYAALPSRKFIPRRTQVFLDFLVEKANAQLASALEKIDTLDGG